MMVFHPDMLSQGATPDPTRAYMCKKCRRVIRCDDSDDAWRIPCDTCGERCKGMDILTLASSFNSLMKQVEEKLGVGTETQKIADIAYPRQREVI